MAAALHKSEVQPHGPVLERLDGLRRLLAEKFPAAERKPGGYWRTGWDKLDAPEGGLRRGAITELSSSPGNGALFIDAMLSRVARECSLAALIDAGGTFDPDGCDPAALARLLRVGCQDAAVAVKAADLLLRDGNLPLLMLDLQALSGRQTAGVPASTWHRFQRLAEETATAFVILTQHPFIESAQVRVALHRQWTLQAQRRSRHELTAALHVQVVPRRAPVPALRIVSPDFRTA